MVLYRVLNQLLYPVEEIGVWFYSHGLLYERGCDHSSPATVCKQKALRRLNLLQIVFSFISHDL